MAILFDYRRAFDNNGDPLVGATLTIYTANTTTPAEIFRDAALSVPMTNPTSAAEDVSDAGGWFPQIFAAEGTVADIILKDSGGSVLDTASDVTFTGVDQSNSFERDFTNSRTKTSGTGGVVSIEAGDPDPDNVGGDLRLGGWAGTQADTIELDAAATTATGSLEVNGELTVAGDPVNVTLASGAHTAAQNLDISIPATGRSFTLDILDAIPSATATLYAYVSIDGGLSFLTSGVYGNVTLVCGQSSTTSGGTATDTIAYVVVGNLATTAGNQNCGSIDIDTPASGSALTRLRSRFDYVNGFSLVSTHINAGARITHIRIATNTGTWTGNWRLRSRKD